MSQQAHEENEATGADTRSSAEGDEDGVTMDAEEVGEGEGEDDAANGAGSSGAGAGGGGIGRNVGSGMLRPPVVKTIIK